MDCPACDAALVRLAVPAELREYAPDEAPAVTVCTRCLRVAPAEGPPEGASDVGEPPEGASDFGTISDALPADDEAALALLLAVGLLDALAHNRPAVEALFERVERAGADPLLVLDRLAADPGLDPAVDLQQRARQVDQLRG